MESTIASPIVYPTNSTQKLILTNKVSYGFFVNSLKPLKKICAVSLNGSVSCSASSGPIPEERIEKPVGLSLAEKVIGDNPRCTECQAKGAVLCATCSGSGLYVDSILESQGIIVKVHCLGCGGTGNVMCSACGGLGYLGHK